MLAQWIMPLTLALTHTAAHVLDTDTMLSRAILQFPSSLTVWSCIENSCFRTADSCSFSKLCFLSFSCPVLSYDTSWVTTEGKAPKREGEQELYTIFFFGVGFPHRKRLQLCSIQEFLLELFQEKAQTGWLQGNILLEKKKEDQFCRREVPLLAVLRNIIVALSLFLSLPVSLCVVISITREELQSLSTVARVFCAIILLLLLLLARCRCSARTLNSDR